MKRVPAKRVVHLPEAARDPVEFSLSFNESLPLPQGISSTQLANYHVTGIPLERSLPNPVCRLQCLMMCWWPAQLKRSRP